MGEGFKMFGMAVLALIAVGILAFIARGMGVGSNAVFAPIEAEVRNQTFKNTTVYNDGMANDLADLMIQYKSTEDQGKKDAIAAVIHQRFASYDKSRLPSELRDFYYSL